MNIKIKDKINEQLNSRFFQHALGDFDEQTIYNFVTNYLIHHGYNIPNNFDFIINNNGIFYEVKSMNEDSENFLNQQFISIL